MRRNSVSVPVVVFSLVCKLRDYCKWLECVDNVAITVECMIIHGVRVEATATLVACIAFAWVGCQRTSIGISLPDIHLVAAGTL